VSLAAAITELTMRVVDKAPAQHLGRDRAGGFTWSCTADEWHTVSLMVEPLLHQSGHQYLTSEIEDDAVIEVSYGECHG
jgi:hypothetical protein